jgi:hypothetical protein
MISGSSGINAFIASACIEVVTGWLSCNEVAGKVDSRNLMIESTPTWNDPSMNNVGKRYDSSGSVLGGQSRDCRVWETLSI